MLKLTASQYNKLVGKQPQPRPTKPKRVAQPGGCDFGDGYVLLILPLPISRNAEPSNHFARQNLKCEWTNAAWGAWAAAGLPKFEQVDIFPVYYHRGGRGRDHDNYVNTATKGILDGLKRNLVPDDNADILTLHAAEFRLDKNYPRLELHVFGRRDQI